MKVKKSKRAKQIVYLFGAGATQAEVDHIGAQGINLLMHNNDRGYGIANRVLNGINRRWRLFIGDSEGIDIEKLISLFAACGVAKLVELADDMRHRYFIEIKKSLIAGKVIRNPKLARSLLEMHKNGYFRDNVETLSGIISTNHDGLLQVASQLAFSEVNLGFPFVSEDLSHSISNDAPPVLQVHGSFTWQFGVPIKISSLRRESLYSSDMSWIPPTILKESKNYPFNKLAAAAYELLSKKCDVLRVIGSSLTQNDWNVLSLIFNAQRHRELSGGSAFRIELIMPQDRGKEISEQCAYIKNLTPVGYLSEGEFDGYKADKVPKEMDNVFAYWLKQKLYYHRSRGEFDPTGITDTMSEVLGEL